MREWESFFGYCKSLSCYVSVLRLQEGSISLLQFLENVCGECLHSMAIPSPPFLSFQLFQNHHHLCFLFGQPFISFRSQPFISFRSRLWHWFGFNSVKLLNFFWTLPFHFFMCHLSSCYFRSSFWPWFDITEIGVPYSNMGAISTRSCLYHLRYRSIPVHFIRSCSQISISSIFTITWSFWSPII